MSQEATPYDAAITDLENRIQYFQTMLDGMKQLRAQISGAPIPIPTGSSRASHDAEIQHDTFFGMTIGDAANKYMTMVKATKSTGDIAAALERGGLKHSSKDFNTTVRSVLGGREDFLRVNGDWGLSVWYPAMRNRERKVKPNAKTTESPQNEDAASDQNAGGGEGQNGAPPQSPKLPRGENARKALELLANHPEKTFSSLDVQNAIGSGSLASIASMLSEQATRGRIGRGTPHGYRANDETMRIVAVMMAES